MKTFRNSIALASTILLLATTANLQAQFSVIHSFAGPAEDGSVPFGSLAPDGSTLYGTTYQGGSSDSGTVFRVNTDGSGYTILHSFGNNTNDGRGPAESLTQVGSILYGMTEFGGSSDSGTIFQISTDGSGYSNLYSFVGSPNDGAMPRGSLTLVGSTLYGMTGFGGSSDGGTIFKINTNGSGYSTLHSFVGHPTDGAEPEGSLIQAGSSLYGTTSRGGGRDLGTIFKLGANGSGYAVLYSFAGSSTDGANPFGSLTLISSTLYGMTRNGGNANSGAIFRIGTTGRSYKNLHSFGSVGADGAWPNGSLIVVGLTLYGMTAQGGDSNSGIVFRVRNNGSSYLSLHSFGSVAADGGQPFGSLTLVGTNLYGMTSLGGSSNLGVIFSLTLPGQLTVKKLRAKVNFNPARTNMDTCSLTAVPALESGFGVAGKVLTVDVGGAQATFTLNAKGRGISFPNRCKLSYARKTKVWTLTASMKKGSWATPWADYGVTNATTPKGGVTVALPVTLVIGTDVFENVTSLKYKATANKSGSLR